MELMIRLYRQHDMDLIQLYYDPSIRFNYELREALKKYSKGKRHTIYTKDEPVQFKGYMKPSILIRLNIDEEKYPGVIKILDKIKTGQRNAFAKAVMRNCLSKIPLTAYYAGDGIRMSKYSSDSYFDDDEDIEEEEDEEVIVTPVKKKTPAKPKLKPATKKPAPKVKPKPRPVEPEDTDEEDETNNAPEEPVKTKAAAPGPFNTGEEPAPNRSAGLNPLGGSGQLDPSERFIPNESEVLSDNDTGDLNALLGALSK